MARTSSMCRARRRQLMVRAIDALDAGTAPGHHRRPQSVPLARRPLGRVLYGRTANSGRCRLREGRRSRCAASSAGRARRELGAGRHDPLRDERTDHRAAPRPRRGRDADRPDHARRRAGRGGSSLPVAPAKRASRAVHHHVRRAAGRTRRSPCGISTTGHTTTLLRGGKPGRIRRAGLSGLRGRRYVCGRCAFDAKTLDWRASDPVPVVESVTTLPNGAAEFSVSRTGTLVHVPGEAVTGAARSLVWVTRQGPRGADCGTRRRGRYAKPRLSPDGTRVALDIRDQQNDIWIWDLARQTLTRLTAAPSHRREPGVDAGQPARPLRVDRARASSTSTGKRPTTPGPSSG